MHSATLRSTNNIKFSNECRHASTSFGILATIRPPHVTRSNMDIFTRNQHGWRQHRKHKQYNVAAMQKYYSMLQLSNKIIKNKRRRTRERKWNVYNYLFTKSTCVTKRRRAALSSGHFFAREITKEQSNVNKTAQWIGNEMKQKQRLIHISHSRSRYVLMHRCAQPTCGKPQPRNHISF